MSAVKATTIEINDIITRLESSRETWKADPGYARCLDIELQALRLLKVMTIILEEDAELSNKLGCATILDPAGPHATIETTTELYAAPKDAADRRS